MNGGSLTKKVTISHGAMIAAQKCANANEEIRNMLVQAGLDPERKVTGKKVFFGTEFTQE